MLKRPVLPALFAILSAVGLCAQAQAQAQSASLEELSAGAHRSEANIARNEFRNPVETLEFFGLRPDMTVIEIQPGGGWYTEIIAPYLRDEGRFYAAHFSPDAEAAFRVRSLAAFEDKMVANPDLYSGVTIRHLLPPHETAIAPAESADLAMTFRNVHNWIMAGQEHEFFAAFHAALKPGGILGVVEHRALPDAGMDVMETSGYVTEAYVKEIAARAGFEFVESSEVNANPNDPTVHPRGVWTLPPSYRLGDEDREKYAAIGESDRMTLKFVKPAE
ncbi:MAG: methyltransferase [Gammaproteobacteria bacterium]|nr:methyltransferase [Gammaproteobacteria bacterium]